MSYKFTSYKEAFRGFQFLAKHQRLSLWREIKGEFLKTSPVNNVTYSKYIFGKSSLPYANLIIHQYSADKLLSNWLNNKILRYFSTNKPIAFPLPDIWQTLLGKFDFKVSKSSTILFCGVILINFIKSILFGLTLVFKLKNNDLVLDKNKNYVHFLNLTSNNIPKSTLIENNFDLISWYVLNINNNANILHDVKNVYYPCEYMNSSLAYSSNPCLNLNGFTNRLYFVLWLFRAVFISITDLIFGKWHHAFILSEAIKAKVIRLNTNLANDYLIAYSGQSYTPMWIYDLNERGIKTSCYFYATFEQPSFNHKWLNSDFLLYSWPNSYFWDESQFSKIINSTRYVKSGDVVGPIWFSDNGESVSNYDKPYIVIFDIPPHRKFFHFGTSTLTDYAEYNNDLYSNFLNDILFCAEQLDILVVHKVKRDIGVRAVKSYTALLKKLSTNKYYKSASPDISPIKLIDKSLGVVSIPFTSTANYGRDRGKPSIFYDPVSWINKNDPAAHDIPIVTGKKNLQEWLINTLIKYDY
jgi:polysaccharide biosynthesis PFTS motif protein